MQHPIATFEMQDGKRIVVELYPEHAPNTVHSFLHLARLGCFDNHAIQRIVPGYVVDASYEAFGREECKYLIANEAQPNSPDNPLPMQPGVIGMGGYGEPGIAGGEFFFPLAYSEKLDGVYPAFGKVIEGWPEIASWETRALRPVPYPQDPSMEINEPVEPIIIRQVVVETFGVPYPEPQKQPPTFRPPSW